MNLTTIKQYLSGLWLELRALANSRTALSIVASLIVNRLVKWGMLPDNIITDATQVVLDVLAILFRRYPKAEFPK